ncbi:uncharacterized protein FYW49_011735 [Xenentodon cancila]
MGCSSSSAQTVDQEKRPGTKPEESNGDTVAVRNGILTEDAQTIEDQMQLPVQTALPGDLQPGTEDETEPVLMAMEAQEDLGCGADLLADPEQQPEPETCEEIAQEAGDEDAVAIVEAVPPTEEVETVSAEAPPVAEVLVEDAEEIPAVESVETVHAETPVVAEEVVEAPAVEPAISEPEVTVAVVGEAEGPAVAAAEAPAEAAVDTPAEEAAAAEAEPPVKTSEPETLSETPTQISENTSNESSVPGEAVASSEASAPNTDIAAATVPEMPPLSPDQPVTEVAAEAPAAPAETAPPTEAPCHTEVLSATGAEEEPAAAPVQNAEAPAPAPSDLNVPSEVATEAAARLLLIQLNNLHTMVRNTQDHPV